MSNIPAEGTPAGDTLAVVVGLSPMIAIIVASTVKPRAAAFLAAIVASGTFIFFGLSYALEKAPGPGTEFAAQIFGGWAAGLSLLMITLIVVGRGLLARGTPLVPEVVAPPAE